MKYNLLLLWVLMAFSVKSQQKFPKDLDLEGLKGSPKQIVETSEVFPSNQKLKEIYYFNNTGYLTKIAHYNIHNLDTDSLYLGDITTYINLGNDSKRAITIKNQSTDTVRVKGYKLLNDSTILVNIKDYENVFSTKIEQKLDDEGRIIKTTSIITDTSNNTVKANSVTEFIYDEHGLVKLIILNDLTEGKPKSVVVAKERKDEFGNFIYREFVDEDGAAVYIVEREYLYY